MHFSSHLSVQNHNILNTRDFIGKGCPGGEQVGEGTQEDHSDTWLAVWGFRGMGLVSGLCLGNPSDSWASWWFTHCSAKMNAKQEGFWEVEGRVVSSF